MSISYDYDGLKAAIRTYAEDDDPDFIAELDDFIAKAETRVLRDLDLEQFEAWQSITISGGDRNVAKPADTIVVNSVFIRDPSAQSWMEVPRRGFEYCIMYSPVETAQDVPEYFSELDADTIMVVPTPNQSYSGGNARARCTIRPTGLSDANTTTWLSTNVGDFLFEACMIEAYTYLKHTEAREGAAQKYQSLIPGMQRELEDIMRKEYKNLDTRKQGADD